MRAIAHRAYYTPKHAERGTANARGGLATSTSEEEDRVGEGSPCAAAVVVGTGIYVYTYDPPCRGVPEDNTAINLSRAKALNPIKGVFH